MKAIVSKNLWKIYPGGIKAIKDLTLEVEAGKIHVIVGPNGAGKTTFLRMVSTEMMPTQGELYVLGYKTANGKTDNKIAIKKLIGVMPQQAVLYKQLTVWEHTYYFTLLKGIKKEESKKEAKKVLKMLELYDRKDDEIHTLSGGLMQCINLAQAITGSPELLILDEPTTGLDPKKRRKIWDYIKEISTKKTILLTTQYLDEAQKLADRVVIFDRGRNIMEGNTDDVIRKVGYELRIEFPYNRTIELALKDIKGVTTAKEGENIVLWAKNGKETLQYLYNTDIDITTIKIFPPTLEEAYLNITGETYVH